MTGRGSKQGPGCRIKESALARLIKEHLKRLNMTQKELAEASGLPEPRISRILRGSSGKGNTVRITERDIDQIALALQVGRQGRDELLYAAFPEKAYIDQALEQKMGIVRLNCVLYEHDLPMLGSKSE